MPLSTTELESKLWGAADILRGQIDSSDYKNYIFSMLFLKRLSDRFAEEVERAVADGLTRNVAERDPDEHEFFVPPEARWEAIVRESMNLGEVVNRASAEIEEANAPRLDGVLRNTNWNDESKLGNPLNRDRIINSLLRHFGELDLSDANLTPDGGQGAVNVLGDAYEYLISQFADDAGKKGGEFYTPRSVVRLIVELLEPAEGMRICDPTAGSAGMLIYAAQYVAEHGGDARNLVLHGQERNLGTLAIGKLNLLLHGLRSARYEGGDVIAEPQLRDERRPAVLLRPGDRQSPVQPQGVGARLRPERLASPLRPLRRDPAEDPRRPRVPAAHARRHEPERHGRRGDAARHPLPRRRRGHDPQGHRRGGPVRGDHRVGAQPLLRRQHPGGDLHPQQGQAAGAARQGAVRRREPARLLPRRQGAERARTTSTSRRSSRRSAPTRRSSASPTSPISRRSRPTTSTSTSAATSTPQSRSMCRASRRP